MFSIYQVFEKSKEKIYNSNYIEVKNIMTFINWHLLINIYLTVAIFLLKRDNIFLYGPFFSKKKEMVISMV
jgi:hypothetical protein